MSTTKTLPEIGEIFASRGAEDMIYMGDHLVVKNVTKGTERRVELTEAMKEALPKQYAKYRDFMSHSTRCSATL